MNRIAGLLAALVLAALLQPASISWSQSAPSPSSAPAVPTPPVEPKRLAVPPEPPKTITAIFGADAIPPRSTQPVGLNEDLYVQVASTTAGAELQLDASKYILFFNGRQVAGLPDPTFDRGTRSLVFRLQRNTSNRDLWTDLLGSPFHPTVPVTVALGTRPASTAQNAQPSIQGADGSDAFELGVYGPVRLVVATLAICGMIWLVLAHASRNTTLRDGLIPQIVPSQQTYSLARCQMTFWFVLIFCAFIFLYIATWDYNTISSQALVLMGISGATAMAAVGVDAAKDSPADATNRGLQALGLNSYTDVTRLIADEIPNRESELVRQQKLLSTLPAAPTDTKDAALTPPQLQWQLVNQRVTQLIIEINDRKNRLSTYEDRIRPFLTQGFFTDITTDINGTAVHRLQVFCWTLVLGAVFLIGVYRDLAMPEFNSTLLALMGISSAGYVGFKFQEINN
jgi:hypothetical protein